MEDIEKGESKKTPRVKIMSSRPRTTIKPSEDESKKNHTYFSRYNLFKNPIQAGKTLGVVAGGGVAAWYVLPAMMGAAMAGFIPVLGYGAGFFAIGYGGKVVADEYEKFKLSKPGS